MLVSRDNYWYTIRIFSHEFFGLVSVFCNHPYLYIYLLYGIKKKNDNEKNYIEK